MSSSDVLMRTLNYIYTVMIRSVDVIDERGYEMVQDSIVVGKNA